MAATISDWIWIVQAGFEQFLIPNGFGQMKVQVGFGKFRLVSTILIGIEQFSLASTALDGTGFDKFRLASKSLDWLRKVQIDRDKFRMGSKTSNRLRTIQLGSDSESLDFRLAPRNSDDRRIA